MSKEVLVLGAGFAGLTAALRLRRKGLDVAVIDIDRYHEFTPGVVDIYRGRSSEEKNRIDLEEFFSGTGIEFIEEGVMEIDPASKTVATNDNSYEYESLLVALGGEPVKRGVDLSDAEIVYSFEGAMNATDGLEEAETVAVVGSGHVGIETAAEIAELGKEVKVLEAETRPTPTDSEEVSHLALDYFNRKDISFMGGRKAAEVKEDGVVTESGGKVEADLVLWAAGIEASEVVQESFDCGPEGLEVNSGLSSEIYEDVFAAGDCANTGARKTAQNAIEQGRLVAENLLKRDGEALESYSPGKKLMVVSLGKTGFLMHGDRLFKNRVFRYLKDLIRFRHFLKLKVSRLKTRFF